MTNESMLNRTSGPVDPHDGRRRGGHGWMMMICCVPMIAIAIALVAAGVASPGFLLAAGACTAMMALMMRAMDHGGGPDRR